MIQRSFADRKARKAKRVAKGKLIHKKLPSLKKMKKALWTVFSLYIRTRDRGICFTCGGKAVHAGHFIPAPHSGTWLDERNVNGQCYRCNMWLSGNAGEYAVRLRQKYGEGIIEELTLQSHQSRLFSVEELERLIVEYRDKYERLPKN